MEQTLRTAINDWKVKRGLAPYSEKTINKYLADIRKLAPTPQYGDMEWASDTDAIATKLENYKYTTQRNYYNSLLVGLYASGVEKDSALVKIYEAKRDLLNAEYDKQKGQNTPSQNIVLDKITPQHIDKMLFEMSKDLKTRQTFMAYTMIQIYKYYQFRNDVAGMEVFLNDKFDEIDIDERQDNNYIVIGKPPESMSFVLNNYKTSKKYGEKTIEIQQQELRQIIHNWISYKVNMDMKKIEKEVVYLFDWNTGTPLTRNDISHLLSDTFNKYLGYSISSTLLRKIYGNIPDDVNKASDEEIQKVIDEAVISGHSVKTKGSVYAK